MRSPKKRPRYDFESKKQRLAELLALIKRVDLEKEARIRNPSSTFRNGLYDVSHEVVGTDSVLDRSSPSFWESTLHRNITSSESSTRVRKEKFDDKKRRFANLFIEYRTLFANN